MKRAILVLMVGIIAVMQSWGQRVQKVEGGLNLGLVSAIGNFHNGTTLISPEISLDVRYNLPDSKWDVGLSALNSTAVYRFKLEDLDDAEQSNRTFAWVLTGHYNFKQGEKVNPYAGIGLGYAVLEDVTGHYYPQHAERLLIKPELGVELFHHLRVGLTSNISKKGFNNIGITIGGVIGGRPVK